MSSVDDQVLALLQRGADATGWSETLAPDVEFHALNVRLFGRKDVAAKLASIPYGQLLWRRMERSRSTFIGDPRPETRNRRLVVTIDEEAGLINRFTQQGAISPPPPEQRVVIDDVMRDRFDMAPERKHPMTFTYVDLQGRPHVSLRGSLRSFGSDHLAMWSRPESGLPAAIAANPNVGILFRDPESRATYRMLGRARISNDEAERQALFDVLPVFEQDHDFAMLGDLVLIELDRIEGWAGIGPNGAIDPLLMVREGKSGQ